MVCCVVVAVVIDGEDDETYHASSKNTSKSDSTLSIPPETSLTNMSRIHLAKYKFGGTGKMCINK